ncbi:unnamed protein product [Cylicostephanus goldi]|uniref:Uncharacterized protein n=1 Tax=Cylicostephanus goldi TaxID=71465 RepID=A0A3P6SSI6_CYLGO|nr:unnamed protein product [Cylicostephanus goldi]
MNLSVSAIGSGHIDDVPLAGSVTIQTNRFHLDVHVEVKRNTRGNPSLRVALCRAAANFPVMVTLQNSLTPESGAKLADAVSRDGYKLFENLLCPRIIYLVEKRINQRFGLLSSKIALGDLNNFDMVKSLLAAQEEFRRTTRRK